MLTEQKPSAPPAPNVEAAFGVGSAPIAHALAGDPAVELSGILGPLAATSLDTS